MRRLLCAFLAFAFCTAALSVECPIGYTPAQYIQLEYIQSTGTQYIDTNIIATSTIDSSVIISVKNGIIKNGAFFGAANQSQRRFYQMNLNPSRNSLTYFKGLSEDYGGYTETPLNNTIHNKNTYSIKGFYCYFNDNVVGTRQSNMFNTELPIFIGGRNNDSQINYNTSTIEWYKVQILDDNVFVRDFVPAMRLSDGKPGMYDKVSGNFFTNAGTGEFIMGPPTGDIIIGTDANNCIPCPPNTYKDFVGDGECTPCPDTLISPSGSKSVSECGRVLHIGDKIYHMKSVKQTSPSLHIRDENGNVWYGNLYSEQE